MVNPQSLLRTSYQQDLAQPGTLNSITTVQKNAAGMNIPWVKATVSKINENIHGNISSERGEAGWMIKNISEIKDVPECRKLGTKCTCPDANPKIVFRNKKKLQFVWNYNVHNEPADAVKVVLLDQYMIRITCIINSYKPKTAELLRVKALLMGEQKKTYVLGGGGGASVQAKNVTYCTTTRGKRGTTQPLQVQKVWSSSTQPQHTTTMMTNRRRKAL